MNIKECLQKIEAEELREQRRHEKKLKALAVLRNLYQKECVHNWTNGICKICGKTLK